MSMKRIIVTGATSMIGVATIDAAIKRGVEVYAILRENTTRINRIPKSPLVRIVFGSLETISDINNLPDEADVFYHFAWIGTNKLERDEPKIQEKNINYTLKAVDLARKTKCRRFVFAGSQAEYGRVDGIISDDTRYNPEISYGIAKLAAGKLSEKECKKHGIDFVWGRIFSVYGPHDNDNTMLDYALKCFCTGKVAQFSASKQKWNYLYESDAGEMFVRMGNEDVPTGTYLIANDESKTLYEYIQIVMGIFGNNAKAVFSSKSDIPVYGLEVDNKATLELLRFKPKVPFKEGIKKMIEGRVSENTDRNDTHNRSF